MAAARLCVRGAGGLRRAARGRRRLPPSSAAPAAAYLGSGRRGEAGRTPATAAASGSSAPAFNLRLHPQKGASFFGRMRVLDPEQLRVKESRKLCPALDPFQSTTWSASSQYDYNGELLLSLLPFSKRLEELRKKSWHPKHCRIGGKRENGQTPATKQRKNK